MAFFEVHRGYVGLGSTVVFRTAEQAAKDLETFSHETGDISTIVKQQGGLLAQQELYTYSTSRGRLRDIDATITQLEKDIDAIQQEMQAKVTELESLGVPNVSAIIGQSAMMVATYWIPGLAALQFLGIDLFGGKKNERKRRAEKLMKELVELKTKAEQLVAHRQSLVNEGTNLSKVMETGASKDVTTVLTSIPKKKTVTWAFDKEKHMMAKTETITDVKDKYLLTQEQAQQRVAEKPGNTRLPEGFQMLYSGALKDKAIVTQVVKDPASTKIVTGQKLVFGGLAGPMAPDIMAMWMTLGVGALFAYLLASEPHPLPVRRRRRAYV